MPQPPAPASLAFNRRKILVHTAAAGALAASVALPRWVHAQGGPMRIVVGYPPGGGTDRAARLAVDDLAIYVEHTDDALDREAMTQRMQELRRELIQWLRKEIGTIATTDEIQFAPGLPKTSSCKIMRRILRKIAEGDVSALGDTSTLADPAVVNDLVANRVG